MAVIGLVWGGQYPPTQGLHQAWRGLALTLLTLTLGTVYCIAFLRYRGAWVVQPFVAIALITSIVSVFFHIIGFGTWPWHKMSPPAQGLMTLITAFVLGAWVISSLYNFRFPFIPHRCEAFSHSKCPLLCSRWSPRGFWPVGASWANTVGVDDRLYALDHGSHVDSGTHGHVAFV